MASNGKKKRPIDVLREANKGKIINIRIDLPPYEAYMSIPDIFLISKARKKAERDAYVEYRNEGKHKEDIIEEEWEKYLKDSLEQQRKNAEKLGKKFNEKEVRANIEREKPTNLARQLAIEDSNLEMIMGILPRMIKLEDGKTPMFPTHEERLDFQEMVKSDPKMFEYLAGKVTEAFALWTDVKDEVKNLSAGSQENQKNGGSKNSSPDDIQDMESLSTQN